LAAYRRALRRFLAFSETAAREAGLSAQQHQAILAIRGHDLDGQMTVGELADNLGIRHHSAVELVDRLARADLVIRTEAEGDRRRVVLSLTPKAATILETLSATHLDELRHGRVFLAQLLERLDPH
jgi:DNA-binding MarR family transcriptional regulator